MHLLVFKFSSLETASKTLNISKFTKEQEIFAKRTIDGVQHQFNKSWLGTLRSQIEGYTRLLIFRKFSTLPAVI